MFLNHYVITICNACISHQVLFHDKYLATLQEEQFPSVLALYTVNTLQSLPPITISITKDVLFMMPCTYGKNLQPCITANTLASLTALNTFCLVCFAFFTAQFKSSILKMSNLTIPKLPSPSAWSLMFTTSSERTAWFWRYYNSWGCFTWLLFLVTDVKNKFFILYFLCLSIIQDLMQHFLPFHFSNYSSIFFCYFPFLFI